MFLDVKMCLSAGSDAQKSPCTDTLFSGSHFPWILQRSEVDTALSYLLLSHSNSARSLLLSCDWLFH